jgi:hypothetical protein
VIAPKCVCGHGRSKHAHAMEVNGADRWFGCRSCHPVCVRYTPKRFLRVKVSKPIPRKSLPRKKVMPRCKHCANSYSAHIKPEGWKFGGEPCTYAPARGIRQRRRTPAAALKLAADGLWSRIVHARPERCEIQDYHPHSCDGGFQAMHGIPRTYNVTRHYPINGFKGCAFAHKRFTERPEEWSALLVRAWGPEVFLKLWEDARSMRPVDMEETVRKLREELAKVSA